MAASIAPAQPVPHRRWTISLNSLSTTQIAIGSAAFVVLVGYVAFVFAPAWTSYGRVWERIAAGFLSLFILAAMLAVGAAVGVGVVAVYVQIASS
jgi:hypothetical protein